MSATALLRSSWGRRVAAGLHLGWILGGGAYLLYCAFTYRGLVRWVGDWEMAHLGSYWWRATFLAGLIVLILPSYVLVKLLPGEPGRSSPVSVPASSTDAGADLRAKAVQIRRVILWIGLASAVVALTSAFVGYRKASEPVVYEPFDLSRPSGSPPSHVELAGIAQTGFVILQGERISGHTTVHIYVPLTSRDWRPTDPVVYFLEPTSSVYVGEHGPARFDRRTPPFAVRIRGTLFRDGLPGTVVAGFENAGLRLAPTTQLLYTRPAADEEVYFLVAAPAGILALLAVAVLLMARFAGRRRYSSH